MNGTTTRVRRLAISLSLTCIALLIVMGGSWNTSLAAPTAGALPGGAAQQTEMPTANPCPGGQCFEDVPSTNTFFSFINSLFQDDIIGGFACGGTGEPCVAPDNRPYYRPAANVSRGQMAKFVDNGRRNIADAVGHSLTMTSTTNAWPVIAIAATVSDGINVQVTGNTAGVIANCAVGSNNCNAFSGAAAAGNRPAYFFGGKGTSVGSVDANSPGLHAAGNGVSSAGATFLGTQYHGADVNTYAGNVFSLSVDHPAGGAAALDVIGSVIIVNDLLVGGSKTGYVVDIMQNSGSEALEAGDVVTIVDTAPAVLGEIPVITVRKAVTPYDTGVVGIVDKAVYVPDATTKATYETEQQAFKAAQAQRDRIEQEAIANGTTPDLSRVPMPQLTITDEQGSIHSFDGAVQAALGSYVNVVTLGSYKGVKVDASSAPIHKGDLLVASANPGYAMKATDRSLASGATIGKALADLETGTGIIPVMVTLK